MPSPSPIARFVALLSLGLLVAATCPAQGRYTVSPNGQEVTDGASHLTWRRCVEGMTWDGRTCAGKALKFDYAGAKKRAHAGGAAWRVPTRDELVGLVDRKTKAKPKIDADAFPKTPSTLYWASRPGMDDDLNAWLVNFANGKVSGNLGQARFPLRLVRDGA